MLRVSTSRFGDLTIDDDKVIYFDDGILGFPEIKRYVILDHDREAPFKWLQAVDDPDVAFVIIEPSLVKPDYRPVIDIQSVSDLEINEEKDICILVIVTIPHEDPTRLTVNLQGPIIVNLENRRAKQIVLKDGSTCCYPLIYASSEAEG